MFHDLTLPGNGIISDADAAKLANAFSDDHVHDIRFADMNGDGKLDLILKGYGSDSTATPHSPIAPFMYLENTTVVPEPSSLVLLGIGAVGLLAPSLATPKTGRLAAHLVSFEWGRRKVPAPRVNASTRNRSITSMPCERTN